MNKVYVVGTSTGYSRFLLDSFELVKNPEDSDIIIFTGGADVNPKLYNEKVGNRTWYDASRDAFELNEFERVKNLNKLIVGICRGAQLLTVLNGGKLIQDVLNHAGCGNHDIILTKDPLNKEFKDEDMNITSLHHQMMYPFELPKENYRVLAYTDYKSKNHYLNGDNISIDVPEHFVEPEIVYYPKTNSLCIQGHPEMMSKHEESSLITLKYINSLVLKLLNKNE